MGGYEYAAQNIISTAFRVKISGLQAATTYKFAAGMISDADAASASPICYGYGNYYFPGYDAGGNYKASPNYDYTPATPYTLPTSTDITTDAAGEVIFWVIISPNNNDNFALQMIHLCIVVNNGDGTTAVTLSNRLVSALNVGPAANFSGYTTAYDYALIEGHSLAPGGKYVFIYDKESPTATDRPLHGYIIEDNSINENSGYAPAPSFYSTNVNGQTGRYGLLYPLANTNGIRRIETLNVDGSSYAVSTDADGIWPSGLNTTSLTKGSVSIISEADAPLPVELQDFTATLNQSKNQVVLNWRTATEIRAYAFEIQRKSLSASWKTIGSTPAHGNSNSPKDYSFTDNQLPAGEVSYRLKMIDNDGSYELSPEASITITAPTELIVSQNYPNPFNPSTLITYSLPRDSFVDLKVYDVLGREVMTLINGERSAGTYQVNFNGNNLPSGTYIYKLSSEGQMTVKKMVLIK